MTDLKEYMNFLKTKQTAIQESGFEIEESEINAKLFPFQKYCVARASQTRNVYNVWKRF